MVFFKRVKKTAFLILILLSIIILGTLFCACDNKTNETDYLEYYPLDNGTFGVGVGNAVKLSNITIPSNYNGKNITEIIDRGFSQCENLQQISIPNTIKTIGSYAFEGCKKLTNITIPSSVINVGNYVFKNCSSLTHITLNNSVISNSIFTGCSSLQSVIIGNSVSTIDKSAFGSCINLTNIQVDTSNPNYSSVNGVLFSKNKNKLIRCPIGFSGSLYTIPSSVISIEEYAFSMTNFTSITIPNSVTTICSKSFYLCSNLRNITIPNNVVNIGSSAFEYAGLNSVTFDNKNGWRAGSTSISASDLSNTYTAKEYLVFTYSNYDWRRV